MSEEALGLIERAAGLLSQKAPADGGVVAQSRDRKEFTEPEATIGQMPSVTIENENVSPAGVFRVAWRYKYTLIGTTLLLMTAAAAVIGAMPRVFVPEALVVIGNREATVPQLRAGGNSFPPWRTPQPFRPRRKSSLPDARCPSDR